LRWLRGERNGVDDSRVAASRSERALRRRSCASFVSRTNACRGAGNVLDLARGIILFESARMTGGTGRVRRLAFAAVAIATATLGCSNVTQDYCPTVAATGGDVVGAWQSSSQCTAPTDRASSGDWCNQLVFDNTGIRALLLGHPAMSFATGTVTYTDASGNMTAGATMGGFTSLLHFVSVPDASDGFNHVFFPRACLNAYGRTPAPTCDDLTGALGDFLADQSQANQSYRLLPLSAFPNYPPGTAPNATYNTMDCIPDAVQDGCDCTYSVTLDAPDTGQWGISNGVLTMYSASSAPAYVNNYGAGGGQLAMSGEGGLDIFGQTALRYLTFKKK
jgi:hypothetical protein